MYSYSFNTPIGILSLRYDDEYLYSVGFGEKLTHPFCDNEICKITVTQIEEYFAGQRTQFDIPIKLNGSNFALKVWTALTQIPYGQTATYSDIAKMAGNERAVRAAATHIGKNPLPIIIPCHRVIRKSGELGQYFGGADIKKRLLDLEKEQSGFK